jgi:FkbM family methyltransferase
VNQIDRARWSVVRRLIPRLPVTVLRLLGSWMQRSRPIGPYPGWRFAIEEQHPTSALVARMRLWDHFKALGIQAPVRIRWVQGLRLDLVLGNDQSRCLFVCGSFEPNEFAYLERTLARDSVFIDIGANEGFYSVFAARRIGPGGLVVAVEPSPREHARLQGNVALNRLKNVRLVKRALGARRGRALLHIADPEHNGQNTLGGFGHAGVEAVDHLEVEVVDLDGLVDELGLARVDVIKIDVEGAELEVLKGALKTLQRHKPVVLLELFDAALRKQGASADAVVSLLQAQGYSLQKLDPASENVLAVHR